MVAEAFGPNLKDIWVGDSTRFELMRDKNGRFEKAVRHSEERDMIFEV